MGLCFFKNFILNFHCLCRDYDSLFLLNCFLHCFLICHWYWIFLIKNPMIFQVESKIVSLSVFNNIECRSLHLTFLRSFWWCFGGVIFFCKYLCRSYAYSIHTNKQFKWSIIHKQTYSSLLGISSTGLFKLVCWEYPNQTFVQVSSFPTPMFISVVMFLVILFELYMFNLKSTTKGS